MQINYFQDVQVHGLGRFGMGYALAVTNSRDLIRCPKPGHEKGGSAQDLMRVESCRADYLQENRAWNFYKFPAFVSFDIPEFPKYSNILHFLVITCLY